MIERDNSLIEWKLGEACDLATGVVHYAEIVRCFSSAGDYRGTMYALEGLMQAAQRLQAVYRVLKVVPGLGKPSP